MRPKAACLNVPHMADYGAGDVVQVLDTFYTRLYGIAGTRTRIVKVYPGAYPIGVAAAEATGRLVPLAPDEFELITVP